MRLVICLLAAVVLAVSAAWAKPTTPGQAERLVLNWLGKDATPLGAPLGRQIKQVQTFTDSAGNPAYYVVYLNPAGMVFVPADDLVEPIIGFAPQGHYDPSQTNPLGALVSNDIPGRLIYVREMEAKSLESGQPLAPENPMAKAQRKWAWLSGAATAQEALEFGSPGPLSDERVSAFLQSKWDQSTVSDNACYNYYTPRGPDGSSSNCVSGCVATAMAQFMRYWRYPTTGVGTGGYAITYWDGSSNYPATRHLRGGDGSGGPYSWDDMTLVPSGSTDETQRRAIGALTHDAGLSVNMGYNWNNTGASSADTLTAGQAFTGAFMYSNARTAVDSGHGNLPESDRNKMVLPNLHAGYPILFGITGTPGGHAIVCDGYGYNVYPTMYHHLNLGWSNSQGSDAWYNLPNIDPPQMTFNSVYKCVYNVYKPGTGAGFGEIIAGRVTDGTNPISGAAVTATRTGGGTYTATTDAKGIYALAQVPSAYNYTVRVSKPRYAFTPQSAATGISINGTWGSPSIACGNVWGVDFVGVARKSSPANELLLPN